ncbi:laccase, multicopper oxidase, benzenediol:oxygen oxidorectuctase [Marasmius tenuissimus]|uniref:laccase n=1 Tax=Marasmius tenuissimus TaxID=585030 RepID=A0ABR2ZBE9_9AGAR
MHTESTLLDKPEHTGTIVTSVRSFRYQVQTSTQATAAGQYCDGLRGALIIYDPNDPHKSLYDIDDASTIISIADCPPNSTLINGKGRYPGGPEQTFAIIKRYRFCVISMVCDPRYDFSIDGHSMSIIEADGISHKPVNVDKFTIFAGQRYSAVIKADQPVGNYCVHANPYFPGTPGFAGGVNSAILRYKGAPNANPTTSEKANPKLFKETDIYPVENPGAVRAIRWL